jgi:hypothetical protein
VRASLLFAPRNEFTVCSPFVSLSDFGPRRLALTCQWTFLLNRTSKLIFDSSLPPGLACRRPLFIYPVYRTLFPIAYATQQVFHFFLRRIIQSRTWCFCPLCSIFLGHIGSRHIVIFPLWLLAFFLSSPAKKGRGSLWVFVVASLYLFLPPFSLPFVFLHLNHISLSREYQSSPSINPIPLSNTSSPFSAPTPTHPAPHSVFISLLFVLSDLFFFFFFFVFPKYTITLYRSSKKEMKTKKN